MTPEEAIQRIRELYKAGRDIVNACRLRQHRPFKALGTGKANYCQSCLVNSRVAFDNVGAVLDSIREVSLVDGAGEEVTKPRTRMGRLEDVAMQAREALNEGCRCSVLIYGDEECWHKKLAKAFAALDEAR